MKNFFKKNHIHLIVLLLSSYSLFLILKITLEAVSLATVLGDERETNIVKRISNGISNPENAIEIALLGIVFFTQGILARKIYQSKNRYDKIFACASFVVGGLFLIPFFCFLLKLYKNEKIIKKPRFFKRLKYMLFSIPLIPLSSLAIAINIDTMDQPVKIKNINFSTNPKNINLIEVFSDGLDNHLLTNVLQKNKTLLKDFVVFNRFLNISQFTSDSLVSIWKGIKGTPPMKIDQAENNWPDGKILDEIDGGFAQWRTEHIQEMHKIHPFSNKATFGIYGESVGEPLFPRRTSGRINTGKIFDKSDVAYNFASVKRDYTGGWKTTSLAPDSLQLKVINNKIQVTKNKNAHLIIADEITHGPLATSDSGRYANELVSIEEATRAWAMEFSKFLARMPKAVYDNSLIVIFSDHGSHAHRPIDEYNFKNIASKKQNGAFLIKYPRANQKQTRYISDRTIYAPYLRNIEADYLKNYLKKVNYDQISDFININNNFDNKPFPTFFANGYAEVVFDQNHFVRVYSDPGVEKRIIDRKSKTARKRMEDLVWDV